MKEQDYLRQQVKLAKAYNKEWSYKQMAEVIGINTYSFYNWLNGYYNLKEDTKHKLSSLVADLTDI